MRPHEVAERIRHALLDAALQAYDDAGFRGLCAEGRWEAALDALRSANLESLLAEAPEREPSAAGEGERPGKEGAAPGSGPPPGRTTP